MLKEIQSMLTGVSAVLAQVARVTRRRRHEDVRHRRRVRRPVGAGAATGRRHPRQRRRPVIADGRKVVAA